MESKISQRLGDIDYLINYFREEIPRAENVKSTIDEIFSEALRTMDQLQLYKDKYEHYKQGLASVNQSLSASIESDCKKADGFCKVLEDFIYRIYPLTEKLRELIKQLNLFISELQEMRKQDETMKTAEELESMSLGLGTRRLINLKLIYKAHKMESEWVELNLKSEVDKLLDAIRGQVDEETEGLTKP